MKSSCGCGVVVGILLAGIVCAGVWYFFYCRSNPDNAEQQFEQVEHGWQNVKENGDKTLNFVRENFTGKTNDPVPPGVAPEKLVPLTGGLSDKKQK